MPKVQSDLSAAKVVRSDGKLSHAELFGCNSRNVSQSESRDVIEFFHPCSISQGSPRGSLCRREQGHAMPRSSVSTKRFLLKFAKAHSTQQLRH